MEFGTGSGYPPTSGGGEGQHNGSRMQQPDRQQPGGSIFHQGQHSLSPGIDTSYGMASLPTGPPPPPPASSPPPTHINDHVGNGAGASSEVNTHSSTNQQQQRHSKQQTTRVPLVNPVAPLNTREGHVVSHQSPSIPISNPIPGSSRLPSTTMPGGPNQDAISQSSDMSEYQQTSISLLRAQLKLVTHERDMLKKDCKRISLERDGAYKHLSLTTAAAAHAASQVASHGPKPSSQQPTSAVSASMDHESSQGAHSSKSGHQLMALPPHHHHRTASDTGTAAPSPSSINSANIKTGVFHNGNPHGGSTLARSHSIASAGDKSLMLMSATPQFPLMNIDNMNNQGGNGQNGQDSNNSTGFSSQLSPSLSPNDKRILMELQTAKKQHNEALQKCEQANKDAEFYHTEAEGLRTRYNEVIVEKQRLEQDVNSLRHFMEEERKEMAELRRQQQEVLNAEGGPGDSLGMMYGTLLRNYEAVKEDYSLIRKRYDDLVSSHSAAVNKLEHSQEEISRYKKLYQEMFTERNQLKQQCTQAIRQWDSAIRERNDYETKYAKIKRQHEEDIKEINQNMIVRVKASKDIKRLTDERNAAMQEYSLIMSERDTFHKEMEKLQDEVSMARKTKKQEEEERRKLSCQVEMLKREVEQSLQERDKAMRESHELREKVGQSSNDHGKMVSRKKYGPLSGEKSKGYDHTSGRTNQKLDSESVSNETIDGSTGSNADLDIKDSLSSKEGNQGNSGGGKTNGGSSLVENLDQANAEIERLRKLYDKASGELQEASMEVDVAKGRRDWAFSERDKVVLERESIRTLCDKLRRERDRAVSELAEALRDSDDVKKQGNECAKENKDLRERLDGLEKEIRIRSLQRSPGGHSHSHDSAIDSDMYEWETDHVDLDMNGLGSQEDLGIDLSGGRDDIHCPGADKPIYISSIAKGSFLDGKLKVNDCILRVNNMDCRDIERETVLNTLKNAANIAANNSTGPNPAPPVSLLVRRRRIGKRYTATLHLWDGKDSANGQHHGLTLDLGVYITRIQPGSAAAKEGNIAVGDRIISINNHPLDHIQNIAEAVQVLNKCAIQNEGSSNKQGVALTLTLAKSTNGLSMMHGGYGGIGSGNAIGGDRALSSSSSGHNLQSGLSAGEFGRSGTLDEKDLNHQLQMMASSPANSPSKSSITSPFKESIQRGSQEFKKLIGAGVSSSGHIPQHHSKHSGNMERYNPSTTMPSSDKDHPISSSQNNSQSGSIKSPFGSGTGSLSLIESVKEKIDNVRHRKRNKEITQMKTDSINTDVPQNMVDQELTHKLAEFNLSSNDEHSELLRSYIHSPENLQSQHIQDDVKKRDPNKTTGPETIKNDQRYHEQPQRLAEQEVHPYSRLPAASPPSKVIMEGEIAIGNGEDLALAELDSVINSYHSSSSGGGAKSSGEKSKRSRRNKDGHSRGGGSGVDSVGGNSFKNGGTWPRTRGGPIIDYGTGTILHPQKHKKERLPLKELLSNLPNYPPESNTSQGSKNKTDHSEKSSVQQQPHNISAPAEVVQRNEDIFLRGNRMSAIDPTTGGVLVSNSATASSRRARPVTAYDILNDPRYVNVDQSKSNKSPLDSREGSSRKSSMREAAVIAPLSPTAIDNSVKSAQMGKEIIERYLKKSKTSTSPQFPDGNENIYHHQLQTMASSSVAQQQQIQNLVRPNAGNSFSPYYSPPQSQAHHQHVTNAHLMQSSPRISSPPPIGSLGDSLILGSPIQQQQPHMHEYRSGSALPSNSTSSVAGLDSLPSVTGRGATVNYHAGYTDANLVQQLGGGNNLPMTAHQIRYGRSSGNRDSDIRSSIHSGGTLPPQHTAHQGEAYPLSLSSMSPSTSMFQQGTSAAPQATSHSNYIHDLIGPGSSATSSLGSIITTSSTTNVAASVLANATALHQHGNSATISHSPSPSTLENYIQQLQAAHAGNKYFRSTTPSSLVPVGQSSGLPQPSASSLLYNHPTLSPHASGNIGSTITSSSGMPSHLVHTGSIQPPYTVGGSNNAHQQHGHSPSLSSMLSTGGSTTGSGYMIPPYLTSQLSSHNQIASNSGGQYSVQTGTYSTQQPRLDYMLRHPEENSPPPQYLHAYKQPGTGYSSKEPSIDALPTTRKRIPSNTSVASRGSSVPSASSYDHLQPGYSAIHSQRPLSKCGSPFPQYTVQYLLPDGKQELQRGPRKPSPGEIRQIYIEKSSEPLGITIDEGSAGTSKKGVFVASVSENSLAYQVGLQVGDQLLDVCGLNLRAVGKKEAAMVLHQVRDTITMKVQFNPVEYHHSVNRRSSSSVGGSGSVVGTASQSSDGGMDGVGSRGNCSNRSSTDEGLEDDDEDNDEDADDMQSSEESLSDDDNLMSHHRQSQKIRSSIKARGPPGPIHTIQQASQRPPTSAVDNGSEGMVRQMASGGGSRSGSPTPRNSPKSTHQNLEEYQLQQYQVMRSSGNQQQYTSSGQQGAQPQAPLSSHPPSGHSTLTRHQISQAVNQLSGMHHHMNQPSSSGDGSSARSSMSAKRGLPNTPSYEPRIVMPVMKKSGDLGVRLVGGNAVGIFIHSIEMESAAYQVGLKCADQILEYNGVDLRQATAEQAAYELAKPAEKVTILVQFNLEKYNLIKDQPGDSYFVRALFTRPHDYNDPQQLSFTKDDILYVDNTMYNGVPGHWSAWIVNSDGNRGQWGIIPSKYKVEEDLLLKRSITSDAGSSGFGGFGGSGGVEITDDEAGTLIGGGSGSNSSRKSWTNARRSFFKRRGKRSSSRDPGGNGNGSKELASYSDVASLSYADNLQYQEENPPVNSYIRVERLDYNVTRPILIVGPLSEAVLDKLLSDYPDKFARCEPEYMNCDQEALEKGLMDNEMGIVDFRRRGSHYECTTVSSIKQICERNQHCILNIHLESVDRLHINQVYPIVLLIKFKSVKTIKEVKDSHRWSGVGGVHGVNMHGHLGMHGGEGLLHGSDKISQKDAKTIFEHAQKLEAEYKHLISDTIHAGTNLMLMCAQIETKINQEQSKTLWVPSGTIW